MVLITQQSAVTDAQAMEVVNTLELDLHKANGSQYTDAMQDVVIRDLAYRHQLAASQLRIERSLMAQQNG